MKHREMCHEWANQNRSHRDLGNMSYLNGVIFSFRTAIAEIVQDSMGNDWYLYNPSKYSPTTSKHQHYIYASIPSQHIIEMWWLGPIYNITSLSDRISNFNLAEISATLISEINAVRRMRSSEKILQAIKTIRDKITHVEQYAWLMDLPQVDMAEVKSCLDDDHKEINLEGIEESLKDFRMKAEKKTAEREAKALAKWKSGEHVNNSFRTMALRIRNNRIETTHQASIPLEDAVAFWPTLKSWVKRKHTFDLGDRRDSDQLQLGSYVVRAFDGEVLTVGCHRIPVAELMAMAKELKLS